MLGSRRLLARGGHRSCALIRLPYSSQEGNSKTIQGVKYTSLQVRKDWRLPLLQSLGLQGVALGNEVFEKEYRACLCHFAPEDVVWTEAKEPSPFLRFGARAVAPRSVQVALPTTSTPVARVLKRTATALDDAAASTPASASPLKIARRTLDEHSKLLEECARLGTELEVWKQRSAEHEAGRIAAETLLAALSNKKSLLTELGASPTEQKYITTTHWSFRRLQCDPLLSKNVQGLIGWASVRAFELFFDLCMAYTRGQTPRAYRRDALELKDDQRQAVCEVACHAHISLICSISVSFVLAAHLHDLLSVQLREHSLDKMFFTLFILRQGPRSMKIMGLIFGFDANMVSRWYPSYVRMIKLVLVHHFAPLDRDSIILGLPPKVRVKFPELGGILDATEQFIQVCPFLLDTRAQSYVCCIGSI